MKITFVLPAIGKKKGERYIRTWQQLEPVTISTLKALTPPDIETEFFDDRLELVDYDTRTDLVAITVEVYTARRAYLIAERFRRRGIPVLMGGYHATIFPDEAAQHADSILIGNAEKVWAGIVRDFERGQYQKRYHGDPGFADLIPDRSIFNGKKYSKVGVVETGRGCVFDCEFCAITAFHNGKYHPKPVDFIVRDVKAGIAAGKKFFFFADDNFVAEPNHTIQVLKALTPLKIKWTGQGSLTMARNPELLKWLRASGCAVMLIGYESLEAGNLGQMNKIWNARLGEADDLTETLHAAGLNLYATFVFGFDHDSPELFDRTVDFALRHRFFFAAFNHLLPMPGTKLHARLLREGKIFQDQWWLDPAYTYGALTFKPATLTAGEISQLCRRSRKRFYTLPSILKRSLALLQRNPDPLLYFYFWQLNLKMQQEVDEKMGLPMGEGLDELPK
jgi:radical SAM superfamily enzyme YgiQ (UPF0313 family)